MELIEHLIQHITEKGLTPNINLDRPVYVQPEDRMEFRAARIVMILGSLTTKHGLSKNVIACVDFLLRNEAFQPKFIMEYFNGKKNILDKIKKFETSVQAEIDFNIVQYKSVPWDIRFNDMFMYLYVRDLLAYKTDADNKNVRLFLTDKGKTYFNVINDAFPRELNFLDLFGTSIIEEKLIKIITEVIPNSYWKQNASLDNQ